MYCTHYGFRENPFNVTSDPSFLYLSHTHKEALSHLRYGIEQRKGFIEITGEIGAGKTTLCRSLLNSLDTSTKTSLVFNPNLPEIQLLEAIMLDFDIIPERRNKVTFYRQINNFLLEQLNVGNNVVLIIDEAQNLRNPTLESIRMLSNLETEKEKLLQIVLVGQPQLREKLNAPNLVQFRQRIAVSFHIQALKAEEVKEYINHRIQIAGGSDSVTFSDDAVSLIANHSNGIPRVINIVCDKSLLLGFVKNTSLIDRSIIQTSIEELRGNITFAGV